MKIEEYLYRINCQQIWLFQLQKSSTNFNQILGIVQFEQTCPNSINIGGLIELERYKPFLESMELNLNGGDSF